ncbi:MAG: hypothetical protein HYY10_00980, partial [Candidatus Liptonbacteria bacterium]|nr:hypothetical protein [Candidatus Liptonbacteria bacterium]
MQNHNKICGVCGRKTRRHGVTKAGTERYFCPVCKRASTVHRPDTRRRHDHERFVAWLTGVESKDAIAKRYGVTRRALSKEFRRFFHQNPNGPNPQKLKAE